MKYQPKASTDVMLGIFFTMLGAAGFASKGVFAKRLYATGWSVDAVLTTRTFFALPIVAVWATHAIGWKTLKTLNGEAILAAALAGILCYYIGAVMDFKALLLIHASVERVLLFSYPSMIVILHALIYRERPAPHVLVALSLTYAGILMVVTGLDMQVFRGNLAGAGLVLLTALTSAIYYLVSARYTPRIGSIAFTFSALSAATGCLVARFFTVTDATVQVWNLRGSVLMACLVVFSTVVPMLAMAEGVRRLGAPRASIMSTIGPPITVILGTWLLDEHLTTPQWLGMALIVAGILNLEMGQKRPPTASV